MRRRTRELYQLAEKEHIEVVHDLNVENLPALYYHGLEDGKDVFMISFQPFLEEESRRLFRSLFAEELGHHFTSSGVYMLKEAYADEIMRDRQEYRARKWAVEWLIDDRTLLAGLRENLTPHELADHFQVVQPFMDFRLKLFLDKQAQVLPLKVAR